MTGQGVVFFYTAELEGWIHVYVYIWLVNMEWRGVWNILYIQCGPIANNLVNKITYRAYKISSSSNNYFVVHCHRVSSGGARVFPLCMSHASQICEIAPCLFLAPPGDSVVLPSSFRLSWLSPSPPTLPPIFAPAQNAQNSDWWIRIGRIGWVAV